MAGRRSVDQKNDWYIRQVNAELINGGNPQALKDIFKDWVGMAKVPLSMDQNLSVLYFIYTKVAPNDRVASYLARTFGKDIITEDED